MSDPATKRECVMGYREGMLERIPRKDALKGCREGVPENAMLP